MPRATRSAPSAPRSGRRAAWLSLDHRQRRVVVAALAVAATLLLPWYSKDAVAERSPGSVVQAEGTISAIGALSFVELAIIAVLAAILALFWGRATQRRFTLPFPDGTLVTAGAAWIGILMIYRLFARPEGVKTAQEYVQIGINWGFFAAVLAVVALLFAALDLRRHGPRHIAPGEPGPGSDERLPDIDPETLVVTPQRVPERRRPRPDDSLWAPDGRRRALPDDPTP